MSEDESRSKMRGVSLPDAEALFSHLADAVYLIDPETSNIVWENRKAWESLGMSREAVLNHSVLSLQEDVHGLPQWAEIAAAIRSSDCFRFNGRAYFLSVARDITNRVAQESGLADREW